MTTKDLPKPSTVTGSCLCGSLAYRVTFSPDHDFVKSSGTCQCTQCRKNTSSLFFVYYQVPKTSFSWTTPADTLKHYQATEGNSRGFCTGCGSMMYWQHDVGPRVSVAVGTIDPLYLFGEGADGECVPIDGFGRVLAGGEGDHEWCRNEIKGVTDKLEILGWERGTRMQEST